MALPPAVALSRSAPGRPCVQCGAALLAALIGRSSGRQLCSYSWPSTLLGGLEGEDWRLATRAA